MATKSVFDYVDYREFVADRLTVTGSTRGYRSRLAETLGVQSAFISQVLNKKLHFGLEQAMTVARFLNLSDQETDYFLLLVHKGRAGSVDLEEYYTKKLRQIKKQREEIKGRIQTTTSISEADQTRYFSSWIYAAIHVLLTVPKYQNVQSLANRLQIPRESVEAYLNFLTKIVLAEKKQNKIVAGKNRIHIGSDNPNIIKHHANWRLQCLRSLDRNALDDQHYSSVMSLSLKDAAKIKSMWLDFLEKLEPIIRDSPEEETFVLTWDFFRL